VVVAVLAAVLAAVFLTAAVLKMRDLHATEVWIERLGLGVPPRLGAALSVALEGGLVVALLARPSWGGWSSAATLVVMSLLLVRAEQRGVGCACFGSQETSARAGLARNVVLGGAALLVGVFGSGQGHALLVALVSVLGVATAVWPLQPQRRPLES